MAHLTLAWELGGHLGHYSVMHPIAAHLRDRGHVPRFVLQQTEFGFEIPEDGIARAGAPMWNGRNPDAPQPPLNFGEILLLFGYHDANIIAALIARWRELLAGQSLLVTNVAPTALIAAHSLGLPAFEISQGFHIPPPAFPAPPLRDWEAAPRARLEAADARVLGNINAVLRHFRAPPLSSIGDIFANRSMLLTYPELDIYPERGPAEYFGIVRTAESGLEPAWPEGDGPRVLGYLYRDWRQLPALLEALARSGARALVFVRMPDDALAQRYSDGPVRLFRQPLAIARLLPDADLVICHGSHQTTAQALLAGKPLLVAPTQLEQFLTTRRVVRMRAGLGIDPEAPVPDFAAALGALLRDPAFAEGARAFARRYAGHDRDAAMRTIIGRCESILERPAGR